MSAVKVILTRENGEELTFGLHPGRGTQYEMKGQNAPLLTLQVARQIGQPGVAVFALPGLSELQVGTPWSELISLGDFVQVDATVQRGGGPQDNGAGFSHAWRTLFFGRVTDIGNDDVPDGDGFAHVTMVTCDDFYGSLDAPQFSYWRNLGASFGLSGELGDKLRRLDATNLSESDVTGPTTARAAEIMLTSFIEGRLDITRKLNGASVDLRDTYGYRFEGDELQLNIVLSTIAPDAQSWKGALEAVIDGPHWYEFFQDCLPVKAAREGFLAQADTGEAGRTAKGQTLARPAKLKLRGDVAETLVVRPAPFPTYRDDIDANSAVTGKTFYSQAAWDSLPLLEAAPFAHGNLRLNRTRKHLFSAFSASLPTLNMNGGTNNAAGDVGQLVGDLHKMLRVVGVVPMDLPSKRTLNYRLESDRLSLSYPQLSRILAYQLFSYHHLNDIYENGTTEIPLELRAQLGVRWRQADKLFYLEGYKHLFTPEAGSTSLTLSRGLPVEMYGLKPKHRPLNKEHMDYVKKYLGRQRPGETLAPTAAQGVMSETLNADVVAG